MPVTLTEIAQRLGVSAATVSNVVNGRDGMSEATRQRVLTTLEEVGYVTNIHARKLAGRPTNIIGMLVPDMTTQYTGEIVRGANDAAIRAGFDLLICTTTQSAERERERTAVLEQGLADGLLTILPRAASSSHLEKLKVPVVVVDHRGRETGLPTIASENYSGARAAVSYLLSIDHRRIGHVTGYPDIESSSERRRGYLEELLTKGHPYDETLVAQGDFSQPGGFSAANQLLDLPEPPTAIFAANDISAFGVMDAVKARGLEVGRDVSVIGFDDIPMARHTYPPLTTVRQPLYEMGEAALSVLLSLLKGIKPVRQKLYLPTQLILRESTKPFEQVDTKPT